MAQRPGRHDIDLFTNAEELGSCPIDREHDWWQYIRNPGFGTDSWDIAKCG